jgi:hypothetical protein
MALTSGELGDKSDATPNSQALLKSIAERRLGKTGFRDV